MKSPPLASAWTTALHPACMLAGCAPISDDSVRARLRVVEERCRRLQRALRAREELLHLVAHELRTPLAGMHATCEVLTHLGLADPAESGRLIELLNKEAMQLSSMIENMLDVARLDSDRTNSTWSRFSVREICESAVLTIRQAIERKSIEFSIHVDPPSLSMNGDAEAIRRLLVNLIGNSLRHTEFGEITLSACQHWVGDERWIRFVVRDTGSGIGQRRLRQVQTQAKSGRRSQRVSPGDGLGLGLAIGRAVAAAHGGSLQIGSAPGCGTEVSVELRAGRAADCQASPPATARIN